MAYNTAFLTVCSQRMLLQDMPPINPYTPDISATPIVPKPKNEDTKKPGTVKYCDTRRMELAKAAE